MRGKYTCEYTHNSGEICGKKFCIRPEGCRLHYNRKERKPCEECGKLTSSVSGKCPEHIRGYYVTEYYRRLREKANKNENQK